MPRRFRLVCTGGLAIALAGLASYPIAAEVASVADRMSLHSTSQATIVFDLHDAPIFTFHQEERTDVPLDHVSPHLLEAVLAIEDRRFYQHHGIDFVRLMGAAWADLRARRVVQGGSSITQQLVRLNALTPRRTLERKFREMLLATAIERRHSKSEILEGYLNKVYFGDGYYGIESAAHGYFGKAADQLTVIEGATLAGLIKSPSTYAPREAPERAKVRRNRVLRAMRDAGVLAPADYGAFENAPLTVRPRDHDEWTRADDSADGNQLCGLYFKEEIRRQLLKQFGAERLYRGGLRVFATIDPRLQLAAEDSIAARIRDLETTKAFRRRGHPETLEAGLVSMDPTNGYVLALVGGRDYHESRFNRATQARRQPGSAFKPLLFAAALENGYSPGTVLDNLTNPIPAAGGAWLPRDGHDATGYTLRSALTVSSNRAAAQLMQTVGVASTIQYARRLGILSSLPPVPSLALGTGELTLLELTSAYSAFANQGLRADPILVRRVEDRSGRVLWQSPVLPRRAVTAETAFLMSSMLADVIQRGTASRARALGFTLPAAGKTGTTDNFKDAWFIGYTPHQIAGVWFGFDAPSRIMNEGFAATVAVPAWTTFMKRATENDKREWFRPPAGIERVTLCRLSGQLATDACRAAADRVDETHESIESETDVRSTARATSPGGVYDEYVLAGSVAPCPVHVAAAAARIAAPADAADPDIARAHPPGAP